MSDFVKTRTKYSSSCCVAAEGGESKIEKCNAQTHTENMVEDNSKAGKTEVPLSQCI